jgi:ribosomal protein S18 acetylase RimI-like enzyme
MNEQQLETSAIEEVLETQEESEEEDELTFRLFVNGELVSWAKTLLYSHLEEIHTASGKKRKGYGGKLLLNIEKRAKAHCASTMKTRGGDFCSDEAAGFLNSLGYGFNPIEGEALRSSGLTKKL